MYSSSENNLESKAKIKILLQRLNSALKYIMVLSELDLGNTSFMKKIKANITESLENLIEKLENEGSKFANLNIEDYGNLLPVCEIYLLINFDLNKCAEIIGIEKNLKENVG